MRFAARFLLKKKMATKYPENWIDLSDKLPRWREKPEEADVPALLNFCQHLLARSMIFVIVNDAPPPEALQEDMKARGWLIDKLLGPNGNATITQCTFSFSAKTPTVSPPTQPDPKPTPPPMPVSPEKLKPKFTARVTADFLNIRDGNGTLTGTLVYKDELVVVWDVKANIGGYDDRAVISPPGAVPQFNVWNAYLEKVDE